MARYANRKTNKETGVAQHWDSDDGAANARIKGAKEPFVMVYQEACRSIAMNTELKGFDLRVLWFLNGILDTENWIDIHHGRLARQMKVSRSQVSRSIGLLVAQGILFKGPERTYRLNPGIGWKGDKATQAKAEKDHIAGHLSLVRP